MTLSWMVRPRNYVGIEIITKSASATIELACALILSAGSLSSGEFCIAARYIGSSRETSYPMES